MHIRVSYCSGDFCEVTRQRKESRANNDVRKPTHPGSSPTPHVPTSHAHRQHNTKHNFFSHIHSGHHDPAYRCGTPTFKPSVFPTLFSLSFVPLQILLFLFSCMLPNATPFVFLHILPGPLSQQPPLPSLFTSFLSCPRYSFIPLFFVQPTSFHLLINLYLSIRRET